MGSINYPASFMLVAAMNPCVCGFLTDPQKECTCTPLQIQRYRSKVSGPLLDQIDIQVEVPGLRYQELASKDAGKSSDVIRIRVNTAAIHSAATIRENKGSQLTRKWEQGNQTLLRSERRRRKITRNRPSTNSA